MKGLMTRSGIYYLRKHVPEALRPMFGGQREVWETLDTRDKREAERRFHPAMARVNARIEAARRALHGAEREAAFIGSPAAWKALDALSDHSNGLEVPRRFAPIPSTPEEVDVVAQALALGNVEARPRSRAEAAAIIRQALDQLALEREDGWSLLRPSPDPEDPEPEPVVPARYLDRLTEALMGLFDAERAKLEALLAIFEAPDFPDRADPEAGSAAGEQSPPGDGLKALAALWEAQRNKAKSSKADMRTAIARFERVNGPLPYQAITAEHVRAFKADLIRDEGIKSATKVKLWSMVSAAMGIGADQGLIENPFAKVKLGRLADDAAPREVFSRDDLIRIFAALEGEEWWLARLGLYTGARLGELHQLDKADLIVEADALFLHIRDDRETGKSVKTRNSVRKVPVHCQLLADGFEEWARSRPEHRLFSGTAAAASKRLNRRLDDLGLGEEKVFHSFRHTFITGARPAMDEAYWEKITGHKSQRVSRAYGDFTDLKAKIDRVNFGIEGVV
jgi:integrase